MNAREGIPLFVHPAAQVSAALDPLDVDPVRVPIDSCNEQQDDTGQRSKRPHLSLDWKRKRQRSERRNGRVQNDCRRGMDAVQDRNRQNAAGRRARQIGRVQRTRMGGKTRERDAHRHTREYERDRDNGEAKRRPVDLDRRIGGHVELRRETNGAADCEEQPDCSQRPVWVPLLHHFDQDRTRGQPEHGERDRHEGEVVPHGDAEDARQKQFELQQ